MDKIQKSLDEFVEMDKYDSPILTIAIDSKNPVNITKPWAEIIAKGNFRADQNLAKILENAYSHYMQQSGKNFNSNISIPVLSEEQSTHIYRQTTLKNYSRLMGASPKFPHTVFIEKKY